MAKKKLPAALKAHQFKKKPGGAKKKSKPAFLKKKGR